MCNEHALTVTLNKQFCPKIPVFQVFPGELAGIGCTQQIAARDRCDEQAMQTTGSMIDREMRVFCIDCYVTNSGY